MKQILLLLTVLNCFTKPLATQEIDYFPMHIGDKWIYALTTFRADTMLQWGTQVIEVTDTTIINDTSYHVFEDVIIDMFYNPGERSENTHYFRKAENGDVMKFSQVANEEQLFYTFQADSLNKPYLFCSDIQAPFKWQITLVDTNLVFSIPLGTFTRCHEYFFDLWSEEGGVLPFCGRVLAPNIGVIKHTCEFDPNFLVGAYINGTLIGDTTVTSVQPRPEAEIPSTPHLYQNYPNPFNGLTRIRYSVPDLWKQPVYITIFDMTGREVYSFEEKTVGGRAVELEWRGRDNAGKEVSSGVYLVRLSSGRFSQIVKVTLLK